MDRESVQRDIINVPRLPLPCVSLDQQRRRWWVEKKLQEIWRNNSSSREKSSPFAFLFCVSSASSPSRSSDDIKILMMCKLWNEERMAKKSGWFEMGRGKKKRKTFPWWILFLRELPRASHSSETGRARSGSQSKERIGLCLHDGRGKKAEMKKYMKFVFFDKLRWVLSIAECARELGVKSRESEEWKLDIANFSLFKKKASKPDTKQKLQISSGIFYEYFSMYFQKLLLRPQN